MSEDTRITKAAPAPNPAESSTGAGAGASPSKSHGGVFSGLFDLANGTAARLDALWEEVGCSPQERRDHLKGLVTEFERLCREKVAEEESVRDQFRASIAQLGKEGEELCARLGEPTPASSPGPRVSTGGDTLTDRLADLEDRVEELRTKRDAQLAVVRGLKEKADALLTRMGRPLDAAFQDEGDLSGARVEGLRARWGALEAEGENRKRVVVQLLADCQALMRELKWDATGSKLDQQVLGSLGHGQQLVSLDESPACVGISESAVEQLSARCNELMAEKLRRADKLKGLGDRIAELWDKLKVPDKEREAFSASVDGLGMDTLSAGERELARLLELKKARLGVLIEETRGQIRAIWEEMCVGQEERAGFAPLQVGAEGHCDDLLAVHEEEVKRLSLRLEVVRPILKLIAKRADILRERDEMEELQKDAKSRLTDRSKGYKRTEELMRIERMDKHVKKDLPLLTEKLRKRLVDWEKSAEEGNGQPFLFEGVSYLQRMDEEEEAWARYKEGQRMEKEARKREELERYRQSHSGSIHGPPTTPGGGNLLPRASMAGGGTSKTPRKAGAAAGAGAGGAGAAPLSTKKSLAPNTNTASYDTPIKGNKRPTTTTGPKTPRAGAGAAASSSSSSFAAAAKRAGGVSSPTSSLASGSTGTGAFAASGASGSVVGGMGMGGGEDQENRSTCSAVSAVSSAASSTTSP